METDNLIKWLVVAVVVMAFGLGTLCVYEFAGLKYYISAVSKINKLTEPNKSKAITDFYNNQDSNTAYRGILAGVTKNGVWVWGRAGLKYFVSDSGSVYTFTDGCTDATINPNSSDAGKENILNTSVSAKLNSWSENVRAGDFVIVTSGSNIGLFGGNLRNALDYNWWYFLQTDMKIQCER